MANGASNLILNALPGPQREALITRMEPVSLPIGTVLYPTGEHPKFAHFMTSGIASVVTFMNSGTGAEVGLIGHEGLVEAVNLIGPARPPMTAFIQVEGTALRMSFSKLQEELHLPGSPLPRILEFVQSQGFILSQLAACNGLHEIVQRLARWLLMVQDRVECEKFYLTQEFLAEMLGSRRTSVTLAAGNLQKLGLIEYRRGHITIGNREGLMAAACECYPIVHRLSAGLYNHVAPPNGHA